VGIKSRKMIRVRHAAREMRNLLSMLMKHLKEWDKGRNEPSER